MDFGLKWKTMGIASLDSLKMDNYMDMAGLSFPRPIPKDDSIMKASLIMANDMDMEN